MNKVYKIVCLILIVILFSGCINYDDPIRKVFCNAIGSDNEYCVQDDEEDNTYSLTKNYTGYYADIDNDGNVDGVIFADLLKSANNNKTTINGRWNSIYSNGTYSYLTIESSKEYTISDTKYTGNFGTKPIISINLESTGNDRFYVMALEDLDSNSHYWYRNAHGQMSDYATTTSENFGTGRNNTYSMINKWNEESYGAKTTGIDSDMWGIIQNQTKYPIATNGTTGWFVPSRAEWSVFLEKFEIKSSNFSDFSLISQYWSSSIFDGIYAWYTSINNSEMDKANSYTIAFVRLATTF